MGKVVQIYLFYVSPIPGPFSLKIPALTCLIACVSSIAGLRVLAPLLVIAKAAMVVVFVAMDFPTARIGPLGFLFYANPFSLLWPRISMLNYVVNGSGSVGNGLFGDIAQVPRPDTTRADRRSLSHRSGCSDRTVSDDADISRTKEMNIDLPMTPKRRARVNTVWNRIPHGGCEKYDCRAHRPIWFRRIGSTLRCTQSSILGTGAIATASGNHSGTTQMPHVAEQVGHF